MQFAPGRGARAQARSKAADALRKVLILHPPFNRLFFDPHDLGSQLEDLFVEVWRQEKFEQKHPFTCAAIRESAGKLRPGAGFSIDGTAPS